MNILYVVSRPLEINTSASIRNRATILGLLENGHRVDLVTTKPDVNHKAFDTSLIPKGIKVKYIYLGGMQNLKRIGNKFPFFEPFKKTIYRWMNKHEVYDSLKGIAAYVDVVEEVSKYDIIISSSDPKSSHLFVYKLLEKNKNIFKGKWIQIWGDPFLGDITLSEKANKRDIEREEKKLLSAADKIVYVSQLTLIEQQKEFFKCRSRMHYVPIPYIEEKKYKLRDLKTVSKIELVYCGDYNSSIRNINPLYEAIKEMKNVHLTICGGSDKPVRNCENITVYGRVSYKRVVEFEKKADILIHLSNLCGAQIPGKIYQYSGTNKPILFLLDGDTKKIKKQFESYGRDEFSENKSREIFMSLKKIINDDENYDPIKKFSKKFVSDQIINSI